MQVPSERLSASDAYKLLVGVVVPRPVAWVTSLSDTGSVNLAPFSAFTFVSNTPPIVGFNVELKEGIEKDTLHNVRIHRNFVVNIATFAFAEHVHLSAKEFSPSTSEAEELGLETVPSSSISTPGLRDVPVRLECVLDRMTNFGDAGTTFVTGKVQIFDVRDDLIHANKIDSFQLDPLVRLGGPNYARLGEARRFAPLKLSDHTELGHLKR